MFVLTSFFFDAKYEDLCVPYDYDGDAQARQEPAGIAALVLPLPSANAQGSDEEGGVNHLRLNAAILATPQVKYLSSSFLCSVVLAPKTVAIPIRL